MLIRNQIIMNIDDQLKAVGKLLTDKVNEHKLTIVEIKTNTGMALNTIKSALAGNPCNISTYLSIAAMLNMTIFDFSQARPGNVTECKPAPETKKVECEVEYNIEEQESII